MTDACSSVAAARDISEGCLTAEELLGRMNPELRPDFRELLAALLVAPPASASNFRDRRQPERRFPVQLEPLQAPQPISQAIPGMKGDPDVKIVLVDGARRSGVERAAIVHMHPGGFIAGTPAMSLRYLQEIALALGCLIVSVDYRLAPETAFPGALNDNYAALKWVYDSAERLSVDRARIAVMGESAGGGHAAMLAITARDRGEVPIVFQALTYPQLDDRTGSGRSVPPYLGAFTWTPADNRFGWSSLLGVSAGSKVVPKGSVPARLDDLRGLPPGRWAGARPAGTAR